MTQPDPNSEMRSFEPRWPGLAALGFLVLWVVILSLPMWTGQFLAGPWSDQYLTGYAYRSWIAEQWKLLGHIPLWNSEIFGGLPLVAGHGDSFYPTTWLRLFLPTHVAMNLGFVVHYVLAGYFTYLLLRLLKVSWTGAVVGGVGYQLSGVVASLVSPGHDGKLYVSTLLPLALIGLVLALRRRQFEGYALLAIAVGLALLSPHYQTTYYLLVAAGLFAIYLSFGEVEDRPVRERLLGLGLALGAVVVGYLVAMFQVLPFYHYIGFSPRAQGYGGFEDSATYAIPWSHVPEFFLSGFSGTTQDQTYWGSNPIKLHSEYLGLPIVALAVLGATGTRRRLVYWLGGIGLLALLVCLGAGTPFYRLWWSVMPFVKQTRGPGMAFYVVAFVVALLAAFGAERLVRGEGRRQVMGWLVVGSAVVLLALLGAFGGFARMLSQGIEGTGGLSVARVDVAQPAIRLGALLSGVALLAVGAVALAGLRRWIPAAVVCLGLPLLVGADLWRSGRSFWTYSGVHQELFTDDPVIERLKSTPKPYRVLQLGTEIYPGSSLMAFGIPQLLGHHGNELHSFDQLLGGKNQWSYLGSMKLWDLLAINQVLLPAGADLSERLPGFSGMFDSSLTGAVTWSGARADLYVRRDPAPYARLVPGAAKVTDEQAIAAILDPRIDLYRVVLIAPEALLEPPPLTAMPAPLLVDVVFDEWEPGHMRMHFSQPAPRNAMLVVSENWYPDWKARVNDVPAPVIRGNVSLITVPVPAGTDRVELTFDSADYRLGRVISFMGLAIVAAGVVIPVVRRRRSGG